MKRYHVSKNLIPEIRGVNGWVIGYRQQNNGAYVSINNNGEWLSPKISISSGNKITISAMTISSSSMTVYFWNGDNYISSASRSDYSGSTFTAPEGTTQMDFAIRAGADKKTEEAVVSSGFWVMLNTGSTASPYEPYGNTWQTKSPPKYGTSTDTITTLPADLYTDGQPIGANLSPVGTFSITAHSASQRIDIFSGSLKAGNYVVALNQDNSITGSTRNTLQVTIGGVTYYNSSNTDYHNQSGQQSMAFTVSETGNVDVKYWANDLNEDCSYSNIMFNSGSTPLPYQPYAPTIIKGDMSQTGTPSPTTPIQPQECGERTGNLFDDHNIITIAGVGERYGVVLPNGTYSIYNDTEKSVYYAYNDFQQRFLACNPHSTATIELENPYPDTAGFFMGLDSASQGGCTIVEGSTPPDQYIPYGYEIPILSNSTTTNVYLGEVQTTRRIGKLVLTGVENWSNVGGQAPFYLSNVSNYTEISRDTPFYLSSHFVSIPYNASWSTNDMFIVSYSAGFRFKMSTIGTDLDDFKTYLAQQYAAGTPVTVWYVLSTPTTGIVNEPLRKIGDYADTVSGITIPTITGKDTVDVLTTLKPSEVELTYTGWHDANVKEYVGGVKANQLQSAVAGTYTDNGITVTCDGQGRYHISGTNTENASFTIPIPEVSFTTNVNVGLFNNVVTQKVVIGFMDDDVSLSGWYINSENRVINNQYSLKNTPINVLSISVQPTTIECDVSPYINVSSVEVPDHYIPYGGQWE